ncbi:MAG: hypothetical protein VXW52_01735, partial [Pseudomonadota bacterium]|nr:hypothetical protein [Pseudomonadota bacterium]
MSKRKIYDIKINGNSITYFQRTQGQTGRDIAAVKLALGNIYLAPKEQNSQDVVPLQNTEGAYTGNIQNNSPEDTSIGEGWFSCDTNEELTIERLLTFDKKLKSSLMAFQIKHQLLVFAYYFEKYYAKNIKTDDEESLLQQVSFMINAFDIEFGTIGEATIAILHGYRPGANASNSSFVSAEENPLDVIPKSLYDSYVNGEMEQLPHTILDSIYSREEVDFSQIKDVWSLAASTLRRWEMKVPTVEVAYVKYIAHSYIGNLKESDLLVATREILEYIENPKFTQDLSPSQRQNLISRAFEPDPHTDPDPFVISLNKVGFFNRTSYTFRDLPEFDNLQQQTRQSLELSALNKVLEFYKKQQVEEIEDPEIINFIDFRAPSLRPNDVYRAYFELDKELIDNSPSATPPPAIATTEAANESASAELDRVNKEISELYCADGSTPNAEEARIQYERYRSFAAKKKLEITRKIRQTILENQEQDLNIDGVEIDLGVFGKGSLSESDIQNLIGSFGNAVIGGASSLTGQGIDWLMGNSDAGNTSQTVGNSLVINYNTLVDYIDKVSENFEKAQEDLANFELEGDPYFSAVEEANKLKNIPNDLLTLLGGDISFSEQLESRGTSMDNYIGNDNTFITFTFSDVSVGSRIIKVQIQSDTVEPTSAFTNFAATEIAQAIQSGQNRLAPQEGYLNGSMRRYRTVHYLRNIEDLADKSSSVANFFNKLANPDSTCDTDDKSKKVGTGAEYILRHTKGITKNKKPSPFNPIHNWRNPSGAKAIQNIKQHGKSVLDRKDKEYYGFIKTGVEMEKVFGFEEALPQLGPPIDTTTIGSANKDLGQKLLKEVSSLLDYKRLMCEYAACLGVPDVQVSIPNLSLPEWPKIPMMELPGSDFKEKLWKMIKDIFYRALYTFLKGIIDILKTPFC